MSRHVMRPRRLRKLYVLLSQAKTSLRISRHFPLICIFVGTIIGILLSAYYRHTYVLLSRSATRPRVSAVARVPPPPPIALLSSAYSSTSAERDDERARTAARNAALRSVAKLHFLRGYGDMKAESRVRSAVDRVAEAAEVVFENMRQGESVTYRALFEYANRRLVGNVVVLHNADIYFDDSVACAGLLTPERRVVMALSRHPSPDCVAASGHDETGWSGQDLCEGYHVVQQASHDVFAFVPPVSEGFLDALGELRVNQFGAENVVLWNMQQEGLQTINPCGNVHAFHAHCDAGARAPESRGSFGNEGHRRKEFGATSEFGFIGVEKWAGQEAKGLDCLLYGLSLARKKNETNLGRSMQRRV